MAGTGNTVFVLKFALAGLGLLTVPASSALGQDFTGEVPRPAAMQAAKSPTGLTAHNDREVLEVTVCGDSLVHVVARPVESPASTAQRPWMLDRAESCPGSAFQFSQSGDLTTLATSRLTISLSARTGSLNFKTLEGETLLRENWNLPRTYIPVQSTALYQIKERFSPDATEAIYGLGQHQSGQFNYRGSTLELGQNNTDVAIPLLISSKGYGILWNTASFTYVDNRFPLDLAFESMAGDQVDYYVLYGPAMDRIIHEYRSDDRPRAAVSAMGLRSFPVQGSLRIAGRDSGHRQPIPQRGIFRSTPLCRTGSGGSLEARATRSSTVAIAMCPPN